MLKFYSRFEISDESGDPLTDHDMTQLHYSKITSLQVNMYINNKYAIILNEIFVYRKRPLLNFQIYETLL